MSVLTALTQDDIAAMLAHFGVWQFEYAPTTGGVENTNYFITVHHPAADGSPRARPLVLTLLESAVDDTSWRLPILLDTLGARGLPVPALVRTTDGASSAFWQGRRVLLCSRLPGSHRERVGAGECAAIGRFMARMHGATHGLLAGSPAHPRDLAWLRAHIASLAPTLPPWQQHLLRDALHLVASLFARPEFAVLPEALVHGDLFLDNALFTDTGLSGVIDFHHAARQKRMFDLAVTLCDWCIDPSTGLSEDRACALLAAYDAIDPISDAEQALLPLFMCHATLAFTLSRLQGHVDRPEGYGKSPLPMLHRLAQCTARPWPALAFRGGWRPREVLPTDAAR